MPDLQRLVQERIAPLHLEAGAEADLAEELTQHLDDRYRELRSGGASEEEAFHQATAELDDMYPLQAEIERNQQMPTIEPVPVGDARPGNLMEDLWRDLRYALRNMRKAPLFVLFVVLTLALGIGANTTVFTVINTLILNPLPVPDASGLVAVAETRAGDASKSSAPLPVSYADLTDYQSNNGIFSSLAGYTAPHVGTWKAQTGSERLFGELVTGNYFSTLGLRPFRGRFFLPKEDATPVRRRCSHQLRDLADALRGRGGHSGPNPPAQ